MLHDFASWRRSQAVAELGAARMSERNVLAGESRVESLRPVGNASPLAPRVAALARQVDAGLQLRDIVTLTIPTGSTSSRTAGPRSD